MACDVHDCPNPVVARGYCDNHYRRWKRYGDPLGVKATVVDRFWQRVQITNSCWLWTGTKTDAGYGYLIVGKRVRAHRFSWELAGNEIPDELELDHLCRVRACVNPAHLEPVTRRENQLRGNTFARKRAEQTACIHGHPFDAANTYIAKNGTRHCRTCAREGARRRREM